MERKQEKFTENPFYGNHPRILKRINQKSAFTEASKTLCSKSKINFKTIKTTGKEVKKRRCFERRVNLPGTCELGSCFENKSGVRIKKEKPQRLNDPIKQKCMLNENSVQAMSKTVRKHDLGESSKDKMNTQDAYKQLQSASEIADGFPNKVRNRTNHKFPSIRSFAGIQFDTGAKARITSSGSNTNFLSCERKNGPCCQCTGKESNICEIPAKISPPYERDKEDNFIKTRLRKSLIWQKGAMPKRAPYYNDPDFCESSVASKAHAQTKLSFPQLSANLRASKFGCSNSDALFNSKVDCGSRGVFKNDHSYPVKDTCLVENEDSFLKIKPRIHSRQCHNGACAVVKKTF